MIKQFRYLLFLSIIFITFSVNAQLKSDTLFLTNGEIILINTNHSTFRNMIKYHEFDLKKNRARQSISKDQVHRVGLNLALVHAKKKIKTKNNISKIKLENGFQIRGKLLAATDSSLLILHKNIALREVHLKEIQELRYRHKDKMTLSLIIGGLFGGYLGNAIGARNDIRSGLGSVHYRIGRTTVGTILGASVGAIIGQMSLKIKIDGQQDKFDKGLKKLKFQH